MTQQSSYYLQRAFLPIKHRLDKEKKYSEAKLDVLASVALGMAMLNGAPSYNRRLLLRLATHVTFQSVTFLMTLLFTCFLTVAIDVDEARRDARDLIPPSQLGLASRVPTLSRGGALEHSPSLSC